MTIEDMLRFKFAPFGHKLLDPQHTSLVLSGKVDTGDGRKYGYGFLEKRINGMRMVGHGGLIPGGDAQLTVFPELGYTVVSLSNYDLQIIHLKLEERSLDSNSCDKRGCSPTTSPPPPLRD